jgi:HlyD family secretion protein
VTDPLSSDLASLRIDRSPPSGGAAKRVVVALVLVGSVGAAGWVAYPRIRGQVFETDVTTTEVALLSPVQSSIQVTATGYIVPQVTSKVGPHDTGRLASVLVKEGDTVKAGQVLAEMETFDQRSAVAAAESRIAVARARVETARATLAETRQKVARESPLVEHGAESKSVLDDLVAQQTSLEQQVKAAEAEVAATEAERGTLGLSLRERTVVAPIDGTVVSKPMKPGEIASPGDTAAIVELADFRSLLAEVDVPENRLGSIRIRGPAEIILDAYPDRHFRGEVVELGKRVDRSKATLVVKVKFSDAILTCDPAADGTSAKRGVVAHDEPQAWLHRLDHAPDGTSADRGLLPGGTPETWLHRLDHAPDGTSAERGVVARDAPETCRPDGVLPEMSAHVSFLSAAVSDDALKAPPKKVVLANAVVERDGRKVVFVVGDDGAAHSVPVTVGSTLGTSVELLAGPASGARVVASPPPELVDGMKVKEKGVG